MKLNLKGLTTKEKERAKEKAGEIIVEEINKFLDRSKSPVAGGRFKSRKKDGGVSTLFEDGDLRIAIDFKELDTDHVEVGVFDDSPKVERLKAFNHNAGDTLPQRRFIASPNQRFDDKIMRKVSSEIDKIKADSEETKQLAREVLDDG